MNRFSKLLITIILVCLTASAFSACAADPYKDYVSSGLEPKTKTVGYSDKNYDKWNSAELALITSYSEYKDFDVELDYTKDYFEHNFLLIFLVIGCYSDNFKFTDILENEGKLYPVLQRDVSDISTDDIIFYAFYAEIPKDNNYILGEIINVNRTTFYC